MGELQNYLPDLLLVYSAFILAVASPGPSNLTVMATAMERGRKPALLLALGVSAFIAANAAALYAVKIVGGFYLLYLAWRSASSALRAEAPQAKAVGSNRRIFLRGYLMHLTNPKAILSWTAIIALGLRPEAPIVVVYAIIVGCLMISLSINLTYAMMFSSAPMVAGYRRIRRWAEGFLAAFFIFAGFKLLTAKL